MRDLLALPRPNRRRIVDAVSLVVIVLFCGLTLLAGGCAADAGDDTANTAEAATRDLSPVAATGFAVADSEGCMSCHGVDGRDSVGPTWDGLHGSAVVLDDGSTVVADADYLRLAITDPDAQIRDGYTLRMPGNRLDPDEVDAVVAYLQELTPPAEEVPS